MPRFALSFDEDFFYALLTCNDSEIVKLNAHFQQIAENPHEAVDFVDEDLKGRMVCYHKTPRFLIGFRIRPDRQRVEFIDLRPLLV